MKINLKLILCFEWIDISEGMDPAKSNNSKKCMINILCFFFMGLNFNTCNDFYDLTMLSFMNYFHFLLVLTILEVCLTVCLELTILYKSDESF